MSTRLAIIACLSRSSSPRDSHDWSARMKENHEAYYNICFDYHRKIHEGCRCDPRLESFIINGKSLES